MKEDPFALALRERDSRPWVRRALTDKSYKKAVNDTVTENSGNNADLATYGDALLKFAYCSILLDRSNQMSVDKSGYESDRVLVTVVGKHYGIFSRLIYDQKDPNILPDYNWTPNASNEDPKHKHIATAVEAVLGALYQEHGDMAEIIDLARSWKDMIDGAANVRDAVRSA